jgi:hypothetical protein
VITVAVRGAENRTEASRSPVPPLRPAAAWVDKQRHGKTFIRVAYHVSEPAEQE